ncbi:MAG: VanZ family protein [Lachnospiraceae bacterium]|nr:VanZ family protein [Lachnospiraceae bacterium]
MYFSKEADIRQNHSWTMRKVAKICFCTYLIALVYYLLFAQREYLAKGYNLVPFVEITRYVRYRASMGVRVVVENLGGNIIGFVPFGFLLPLMGAIFQKGLRVCLLIFIFSFCVEGMQLILQAGCFDVDDILLNTTGGIVGFILYLAVVYIRSKINASKKEETSR